MPPSSVDVESLVEVGLSDGAVSVKDGELVESVETAGSVVVVFVSF